MDWKDELIEKQRSRGYFIEYLGSKPFLERMDQGHMQFDEYVTALSTKYKFVVFEVRKERVYYFAIQKPDAEGYPFENFPKVEKAKFGEMESLEGFKNTLFNKMFSKVQITTPEELIAKAVRKVCEGNEALGKKCYVCKTKLVMGDKYYAFTKGTKSKVYSHEGCVVFEGGRPFVAPKTEEVAA